MAIATEDKRKIVETYRRHERDGGSPEVQIAVLTARIGELTGHLRTHEKDFAGRRGLLMMVGKRNRLLKYLAGTDRDTYERTIKSLGLRK